MKRIIGKKYDREIQKDIEKWPFNVIEKKAYPAVTIGHKEFYPHEISAMVLKHAKKIAEDHVGHEVTKAVIAVPAYFDDDQRQATKDAAEIAGLEVFSLINEPTAAVMAYGWDTKSKGAEKVLVYDFGGGTFDVSVVNIENNNFTVLVTDGDTQLGGGDIDNNLVEYVMKWFDSENGTDMKTDNQARVRLMNACTNVKEKLSFHKTHTINLKNLHNGRDLHMELTREKFEDLNMPIFRRTMKIVDDCLKNRKIEKNEITNVVLVGGSTRIPRIQKMLIDYFKSNKQLKKNINPDEAVAYGAAIHAAALDETVPEFFNVINISNDAPNNRICNFTNEGNIIKETNASTHVKKKSFTVGAKLFDKVELKVQFHSEEYYRK